MHDVIVFDFKLDTARLMRAFESTDDVGAIIRTHYELDRALDHVLVKFYANPRKLGANRVGPKIERLEALGFGGARVGAVRVVDDVRNGVAHRDREEICPQDVAVLRKQIDELSGKRFKDDWQFSYKAGDCSTSLAYGEMSLRQKFCFLAFLAIAALASLPHEVDRLRNSALLRTSEVGQD
jgi:hypothetical protein